jgi:micrococcal nuclease
METGGEAVAYDLRDSRFVILAAVFARVRHLLRLLMNYRCLLAVFVLVGSYAHGQDMFTAQVTRVSDGDTVWVQPDSGGQQLKLRLEGIDAPEMCQAGGDASRAALQALTLRRTLDVTVRAHDDYGRGLARLTFRGQDIGAEMVRTGQAWSYRWRRSMGPYASEEKSARLGRRGLFSQEDAQLPRDFRKQHGTCFPLKQ